MKFFYLNIIAGMLALLVVPVVQAVPEQLTDTGHVADFPDLRADSSGNRHLVWYDADVDSGAIMYRMFSGSGNLLINTTQINNGGPGSSNTRPSLAIDGSNRLLVVWQNNVDGEIYFLRLDPSLDNQDGDPADIATLKDIDDTRISDDLDGQAAVHARSAIDASGNLHVVWEDDCGPNVRYVKISNAGVILTGPVLLGGGGGCNDFPDIALDSAGNVHVVFSNTGFTAAEEVYYAMIDGSSGDVLIDSTLLTLDDGLRATRATLAVDPRDDRVYVVLGQVTASAPLKGESIFMLTLDPSLDDRDGSTADPAVIRLNELQVSSGSPQFGLRAFSRYGFDQRIHVTYMDFDAATCLGAGTGGPYTITHAHVSTVAKVMLTETVTTTGIASAACDPEARLVPNGSRILWADSAAGASEIFSDTFPRADSGSSGFTCSIGPPGSAWRAGDFWLLLAGLVALGAWRRRVYRQDAGL